MNTTPEPEETPIGPQQFADPGDFSGPPERADMGEEIACLARSWGLYYILPTAAKLAESLRGVAAHT